MVDRLVNSESNTRRIAHVENCFGTSGQPLAVPGRVLVGEGVLTKMCRKKPKPRQFFLFNDALVYGNIVINKKKYNTQHIMPLEDVKLESVEDDGNLRNGWKIISPSKSFVVYAATAVEKQQWISHIKKCVSDLLVKRNSPYQGLLQEPFHDSTQTLHSIKYTFPAGRGKTQSEVGEMDSPVWVPDSSAPKCMHCRRSEFSMLNRRHHCRKCGKVVCNDCSSKRWLLPQQSSKPLRVCLTCFEKLSSARTQSVSDMPNTVDGASGITNAAEDSSGEESDEEEEDGGAVYQGIPDEFHSYEGEHQ